MSTEPTHVESLPFETDGGLGQRARIGLVVLQSDQTVEYEVASLLAGDGVAIYHARIPNATEVTPDTLRQMALEMPDTVSLLPSEFEFNAIGYGCTSGATMIGEARVDEIIRSVHPNARTSNPISACKAALRALGLKRIALLTPYTPDVTVAMQQNLNDAGFEVNAVASFGQSDDFTVARITSRSIFDAVTSVGARDDVDGVFVSCTSLRALPVINDAEAALGKPVIASNQAMAWHLMRLASGDDAPTHGGRLFQMPLADVGS